LASDAIGLAVGWVIAIALAAKSMLAAITPLSMIEAGIVIVTTVACLAGFGLYSVQARYLSLTDIARLASVCLVSGAVAAICDIVAPHSGIDPLYVFSLQAVVAGVTLGGIRFGVRRVEALRRAKQVKRSQRTTGIPRTLLVGAGDAGDLLTREVNRMSIATHQFVGAVDDDPRKSCTRINGVPVLGTTSDIAELCARLRVDEVIIALPSVSGPRMREIVALCRAGGRRTTTLPAVQDLIVGKGVASQLREVEIVDLLRREPVHVTSQRAPTLVQASVVLITGGGGSIGGELARQIARLKPEKLVLVGKGENSLFEVEQQILLEGAKMPDCVVADVRDRSSMETVFRTHKPDTVFHAAAHKHVPLMEGNPIEAIRNNVFGTLSVVEAAIEHGAKRFTYVSTDKAVNCQNVMGASKRVAELVTRSHMRSSGVQEAIVRFGNVLGSRGSLIPVIEGQIRRGGPVRVTHREMTRFFMTIPEAVHLILEATALSKGGETFILDMGEAIKIYDLVCDLIRLHGHEPEITMPIIYTGPRPGEKLHEELTFNFESLVPTDHPKIRSVRSEGQAHWNWLNSELKELAKICDFGDQEQAREALMCLSRTIPGSEISVRAVVDSVPEYSER
jgi:FlaA1/EpsC-like NDP-sugar epimerase